MSDYMTIAEELREDAADEGAVAIVGVAKTYRDGRVAVRAIKFQPGDDRRERAMTFGRGDIVAQRQVPDGDESVLLISRRTMDRRVLNRRQRDKLAAEFLTGSIGGELLIPGTIEGAAWRLGLVITYDPADCVLECSLRGHSPRC
jgi:hypothetical protein